MKVDIIYEDADMVAVNKPAGLVVHSDGRTKEETLVDWALQKWPEIVGVGESLTLQSGEVIERPGVVHRIDRETSGVLVLAKNQEAHAFLKEQFQGRMVSKLYNAFVYGTPKDKKGTVDLPIGRSTKDFRLWTAGENLRNNAREAVTEYKVVQEGEEASFLELRPQTGRTHQIRVHMKALGHPVVCDKRYAPKRACLLGFQRLALHARSISLSMPSGVSVTLEAPLPEDFEEALKQL